MSNFHHDPEAAVKGCPLTEAEDLRLRAYLDRLNLPDELIPLLSAALVYGRGYDHPEGFGIFTAAELEAVNTRMGETAGDFFRTVTEPNYSDYVEPGFTE